MVKTKQKSYEKGPEVQEQEGQGFLEHFKDLLETVEVVAISGSLPAGLPVDYYASLVELANQAGKTCCLGLLWSSTSSGS